MWVRKITKVGNSKRITLPPAVLETLDWEIGDHLVMHLLGDDQLILTRFNPTRRPDILAQAQANELAASGKIDTIKA